MKGYLEVAQEKKLYNSTYHNAVVPDKQLPIQDQSYDVLLCCAGFFDGLMSPRVFPELIRITKKRRRFDLEYCRWIRRHSG